MANSINNCRLSIDDCQSLREVRRKIAKGEGIIKLAVEGRVDELLSENHPHDLPDLFFIRFADAHA